MNLQRFTPRWERSTTDPLVFVQFWKNKTLKKVLKFQDNGGLFEEPCEEAYSEAGKTDCEDCGGAFLPGGFPLPDNGVSVALLDLPDGGGYPEVLPVILGSSCHHHLQSNRVQLHCPVHGIRCGCLYERKVGPLQPGYPLQAAFGFLPRRKHSAGFQRIFSCAIMRKIVSPYANLSQPIVSPYANLSPPIVSPYANLSQPIVSPYANLRASKLLLAHSLSVTCVDS
ncbi:hypothetical protein CDAR_47891 [Caerostris darwini]|uniref:Uncharacterized protein n=1 Tax=Caerostris darwini TaxID=1538125 RepID=A0AAV4M8K1_9ARAC|nr:hypothetical protein CDAR_47891 [Caerostris darwini]